MSRNRRDVDFELGLPATPQSCRLRGYPSFAQFIARDADAAIYRRYSHLSARNLLCLQSELHELEARLQQLDREDAKDINDNDAQKAVREWKYYCDPENDRAHEHRVLQGSIRSKMREYRA